MLTVQTAMVNMSNKTTGITNDAERIVLTTWSIAVILTSLIGDSIVLIATTKYHAIKLHRVLVTLIQHLAISNLLQTLFRVLPITPSFTKDTWVMGTFLCHVEDHIGVICNTAALLLTCCLSTIKLLLVKFPLRLGHLSVKFGHKICVAMWTITLVWYLPGLIGKLYIRDTIHFSKIEYKCNYNITTSLHLPDWIKLYFIASYSIILLLTYTLLALTSALLLRAAKRAGNRAGSALRWEGVVTVLSTVIVLILSSLPLYIVVAAGLFGVTYSGTVLRAASSLQYLFIVANFFIYSVSLQSFRQFLKVRLLWVANFCSFTKRSSNVCSRPRQESRPCPRVEVGSMEEGAGSSLAVKIQDLLPKSSETEL